MVILGIMRSLTKLKTDLLRSYICRYRSYLLPCACTVAQARGTHTDPTPDLRVYTSSSGEIIEHHSCKPGAKPNGVWSPSPGRRARTRNNESELLLGLSIVECG